MGLLGLSAKQQVNKFEDNFEPGTLDYNVCNEAGISHKWWERNEIRTRPLLQNLKSKDYCGHQRFHGTRCFHTVLCGRENFLKRNITSRISTREHCTNVINNSFHNLN